MEVRFYQHDVNKQDRALVDKVLRGEFLTTGAVTREVEQQLAKMFRAPDAIGTTNWTSAAELLLRLWGVGEGDEVIVPTMSYVASAHVVALRNAKPVFVDSDPKTGLLDLNQVEDLITDRTKVIMPVHLYGVMADMKALKEIADRRGIKLFEDAAHAVISSRDGVRPGELSDAAALSFYATKNVTSGEGGALITQDREFAEYFRKGTCGGVTKRAHDRHREGGQRYVGYDSEFPSGKCNMTNIQAALLKGQLERLDANRRRRAELVQRYRRELATIPGIQLPLIPEGAESSYYVMVMLVQNGLRDRLFDLFAQEDIGCAINFRPIHLMTAYRKEYGYRPGEFPVAEGWGERCVTLPLYPALAEEQVDYITGLIREHYTQWVS